MRHTNTLAALALVLSSLATAAGFAPAQLRDFPQDQLTLQHGSTRIDLQIWVADTDARQSQGLMFLTELPQGYGMLFPLTEPRIMNMWMKNTYVPLDMVFIGIDGQVLRIATDTVPQSTDIISSGAVVGGVLEIRAGESKRLGLKVGDRVLHRHFGNTR
jgi:uncharacterized membrane protein (UPF0127 family)